MQTKTVYRSVSALLVALVLGLTCISGSAVAQDKTYDSKLIQYLQDAKKSGEKQSQAQQKAIKAGWPAAAVKDAATYVYASNAKTPPAASATGGAPMVAEKPSGKPALGGPAGNTAPVAAGISLPYEYRIGSGDVLQISVWKEPEASASVIVRPDGMISTPLIKEIQVVGLTPTQAEKLITEKLIKVIQEPDVTVVVTGLNSKKIYAVGAVKKEGPIPYTYSMTVMQAIAEAGGLTDYAKRKKIYVLRNENGKQSKFNFDYDAVLRGTRMELNVLMLPGDTLVVPH